LIAISIADIKNKKENVMQTHVKVVGWLWIVNGLLGIFTALIGLIIVYFNVSSSQDFVFVLIGTLCVLIPAIVADFLAGTGLLQFKSWARYLAIVLAIINLLFLCYLILPAALGIYTLVIMFNKDAVPLFNGEYTPAEVEGAG
jgi:hypothetical protein